MASRRIIDIHSASMANYFCHRSRESAYGRLQLHPLAAAVDSDPQPFHYQRSDFRRERPELTAAADWNCYPACLQLLPLHTKDQACKEMSSSSGSPFL